jgi:hypothetical protein
MCAIQSLTILTADSQNLSVHIYDILQYLVLTICNKTTSTDWQQTEFIWLNM